LAESGKKEFERVSVKIGGRIRDIPDYIKESMYNGYIKLIEAYVGGETFDEKTFKESKAYLYILRFIDGTNTTLEMKKMFMDTKKENLYIKIEY